MDVRMPELDGMEATRRIRAELPSERQPRVIALTANAMTEDRKACEASGMDDFMSKPITTKELERVLRAARPRPPSSSHEVLGGAELDALLRLTAGSPETLRQIIDDYVEASARLVGGDRERPPRRATPGAGARRALAQGRERPDGRARRHARGRVPREGRRVRGSSLPRASAWRSSPQTRAGPQAPVRGDARPPATA
jgi:CheY-like chemotaxis protein